MNNKPKLISIRLAIAVVAGLASSTVSSHAQGATATISGVAAGGGLFDYTITLTNPNSDTFSLNDFWYGWIQFQNDLPSDPSNAANSLGWANDLDGNSIEWENNSGTALAPGQSATFTFVSADSPSAITTSPSGESVAYVNGIDFSENSAGHSTPIFSPTLVAAPEPSSVGLFIVGSLGLLATGWRKLRVQK